MDKELTTEKAYGPIDPNSAHQMWSRWTFEIEANPKRPLISETEIADNARRFFSKGFFNVNFGTCGRVRCDRFVHLSSSATVEYGKGAFGRFEQPRSVMPEYKRVCYGLVLEIEGPPAHDPGLVEKVRQQFADVFVAQGFGHGARLTRFEVGVLAGDQQDGKPPDQLLVMPRADFSAQMWGK